MNIESVQICSIEKKENVLEVKTDGSHDIFIRGQPLVDEVGIIDNIPTENEATTAGIYNVQGTTERDENPNYPSHYYEYSNMNQHWKSQRQSENSVANIGQ